MSKTNYIMMTALVQMLFILIELTQSGRACLPNTELKGEEELQFFDGAYCKNLCYKFPAHPGQTHTQSTHPYMLSHVIQGF